MNSELEAAERAEFIQSVKALLIPLCLFLACVIAAAGTFLIYNHEPVGWAFATVAAITILTCIVWLIRFQNNYRARGILKHGLEAENISDSPNADSPNANSPSADSSSAHSLNAHSPNTLSPNAHSPSADSSSADARTFETATAESVTTVSQLEDSDQSNVVEFKPTKQRLNQ